MSRPKLQVNEVWILEEVLPYEGGEIINVFVDVEVAKDDPSIAERAENKVRWRQREDGGWTTRPEFHSGPQMPYFIITKYPIIN